MTESLANLVRCTPDLYPLPKTLDLLRKILDDDMVEADVLVPIVEQDPGLVANILKLCNSSAYGQRRRFGSVKEALVLIGNRTLVKLAFGLGFREKMSRGVLARPEGLWQHSLGTAFASSHIVGATGSPHLRDRAFTAGLLHDIGKLLVHPAMRVRSEPDELPEGLHGLELLEVERGSLGFDHAEAGAALVDAWKFPRMLVEAIRFHHAPEAARAYDEIVIAVHAADAVSHAIHEAESAEAADAALREIFEPIGVPDDTSALILEKFPRHSEDLFLAVAGA